jgi:hypothetical protein
LERSGGKRKKENQTNANKTKLKKNSNQYKAIPTPTTNYFSLLSSEENTDNIQRKKELAPPPILVPGIKNAQRLMTMIEEKIRRKDYTMKIINNDTIKILTTKLEEHKNVADTLKTKLNFIHINRGNNEHMEW